MIKYRDGCITGIGLRDKFNVSYFSYDSQRLYSWRCTEWNNGTRINPLGIISFQIILFTFWLVLFANES